MNEADNYAIGWAIGKARELMRDAQESGAGAAGLAALASMLPTDGSVKPEQAAASTVIGQRP